MSDWNSIPTLNTDSPHVIVAASEGAEGSGKSAFWLGAPELERDGHEGLYIAGFDPNGLNRVAKKFKMRADGVTPKVIRHVPYAFNPRPYKEDKTKIKEAAGKVWTKFVADYYEAIKRVRTIIIDREDMCNKVQRYKKFGDTSGPPAEYEELTIEMVSMIQDAYSEGVNVGLIRGLKEKWVQKFDPQKQKMVGHNTGEMVPSGMKGLGDHVDIVLGHRWDPEQKAFMTKLGPGPAHKFTNPEYRGLEFPDLDFALMAMNAYPETDPEWWL